MRISEDGYIICPTCGKKTKVKLNENTIIINFPLYCSWCKEETIVTKA